MHTLKHFLIFLLLLLCESFSFQKEGINRPKRYAISYSHHVSGPAIKFRKTTTALNQHRLERYIREHVSFPPQARDDKFCGRATISFKIDSKGQISSVEIVNTADVHPAITSQLSELMSKAPAMWSSYKNDDKALKNDYGFSLIYYSDKCKPKLRKYQLKVRKTSYYIYKDPIEAWVSNKSLKSFNDVADFFKEVLPDDWDGRDKYHAYSGETSNIQISIETDEDPMVKYNALLVYPKQNFIEYGYYRNEQIKFKKKPYSENVILLVTKFTNGDFEASLNKLNLNSDLEINEPEFASCDKSQLLDILKESL